MERTLFRERQSPKEVAVSALSLLIAPCTLALTLALPFTLDQPGPGGKIEPRVDHYGDLLPKHALLRIGTTRLRPNVMNSGVIDAMAFTRDGKRLVMLTEWRGAQVWDLASGKLLLEFGKPAIVGGAKYALSADGSRAAVIESEKVCRCYDTADGKLISTAVGDWYGVSELRFSPDNKFLGASHREATAFWDVASGAKSWQVPLSRDRGFGDFAFAPEGKVVVFAPRAGTNPPDDPMEEHRLPILLFDLAKGPTSERPGPIEVARARNLIFSPDGKILAAEKWHREFILWNVATGKPLHEPETQDDMVWCMGFSPDGKWIVTGSNHGRVRLWDVATGKLHRKFSGFDSTIVSLAFSPDSRRVAASCSDGTFRLWEVASRKEALQFEGHRMRNVQARFGSDGKTIVSICGFNPTADRTADERTYRTWDATTGKPLGRIKLSRKDFLPFCLSGDKSLFVIDGGKITKKSLATGKTENVSGLPANYYSYQCSADGRYLAGYTDDFWGRKKDELVTSNTLKVVDTTTGKEVLAYAGRKGEKFHCRFTEDGRYLAVHSFCYETDGSMGRRSDMHLKESFLTIWDVRTGRKTPEGKLLGRKWKGGFRWPGGESLSPDRSLALTRGNGVIELRDLTTNRKLAEFPAGGWDCESWAFSRDGKFIAVGNEKGQIFLSSVSPRPAPPKALATLEGHRAAVTSVHFSPDGARLVSGSDDTTIIVWNIAEWTTPEAKRK
jgi:WD40 repeat protein